jgi:hypothetical protein
MVRHLDVVVAAEHPVPQRAVTGHDVDVGYIRGAQATADGRGVGTWLTRIALLAMAILVVVLTFSAITETMRATRLREHGIELSATILSCTGIASGTGITAVGYACRADFTVDGARHIEVLRGDSGLHTPGEVVPAIVDPSHPDSLTARRSVPADGSTWRAFRNPLVALGVLLLLVLLTRPAIAGWRRRQPATAASMTAETAARHAAMGEPS